ncbi:MAG: GNAT family N-acetyltransferase [Planctomycetota bacterium]|nr:GNAT family N-acetyltransferase [Planctomycetota bacterium]
MITVQPVTRNNWVAVASLELLPEQAGLVAPNVGSLAAARFDATYQPRAILNDGVPVGFSMRCTDDEDQNTGIHWLFRFMLGAGHQGKGHGKAGLALVLEQIWAAGASSIRTMHKPKSAVAARPYAGAGFHMTGMLDDGDVELLLHPARRGRQR